MCLATSSPTMQVGAPSENFKMLTTFRQLKQSRAMNHHRSPPDGGGTRKPDMFPLPHRQVPSPLGLMRYGSAPGTFLSGVADSVIGGEAEAGFTRRLFPGESPSPASESSCKSAASTAAPSSRDLEHCWGRKAPPSMVADPSSSCPKGGDGNLLLRHSSSPADFFSHLMLDNGFSALRDIRSFSRPGIGGVNEMASRRLKSQLSFSGTGQPSQISQIGIPEIGDSVGCSNNSDVRSGSVSQSYSNFSIGSWDDTNSIIFSAPSSKRAKDNNGDIITMSNIESQCSLPSTTLEMDTMDKYLQFQHDQVPFKVRAKRGCATHPRSIAERERRTRISEKLKSLQDLVPNMDKQTSTADMLDLAIKHIKELQSQLQVLKQEQENCKCKKA
ncbi:unnamed protein product [Musa hybrid cultivar]